MINLCHQVQYSSYKAFENTHAKLKRIHQNFLEVSLTVDGVQKLTKWASIQLEITIKRSKVVAESIFATNILKEWNSLGKTLEAFDLAKRLYTYLKGQNRILWAELSLISQIVYSNLTLVQYLAGQGLFDLSEVVKKIGMIPIFGKITKVPIWCYGAFSLFFDLCAQLVTARSNRREKMSEKLSVINATLRMWQLQRDISLHRKFGLNFAHLNAKYIADQNFLNNALGPANIFNFTPAMLANLRRLYEVNELNLLSALPFVNWVNAQNGLNPNIAVLDMERTIDFHVRKWTILTDNARSKCHKPYVAAAASIVKLAKHIIFDGILEIYFNFKLIKKSWLDLCIGELVTTTAVLRVFSSVPEETPLQLAAQPAGLIFSINQVYQNL